MSQSARVVVADRFVLDSDLLVRAIGPVAEAERLKVRKLLKIDGLHDALVLVDALSGQEVFEVACRRAGAVGLLFDDDSAQLRERAARREVRLVVCRSTPVPELRQHVLDALGGHLRRALPAAPVDEDRGGPCLSRREAEVLELMARGLGNRDIADSLSISPHTVRTHVQAVLAKFDKGSRVAAVGAARQAGLLTR